MSKKGNLGRSLIKDKFGKRNKKNSNENFVSIKFSRLTSR